MKKTIALLAILFILALLVIAGCTTQKAASAQAPAKIDESNEGVDDEKAATAAEQFPEPAAAETREITITARKWEFEPAAIEVNKGERVALTIASEDVKHGFSLPDFDVNIQLEPGRTVTAEFVADKAGTFEFSCSVYCGSGHGDMVGKLVVRE